MSSDLAWKIGSAVTSIVLVPTFLWVWNTNTELSKTQVEFSHASSKLEKLEKHVDELERNTTDIAVIQRDIQHLDKKMDELKELIVNLKN